MTKLEEYLENEKHFRDYTICSEEDFGKNHKRGVHQKVDPLDFEHEVDDAIRTFCRDGYGHIYFYVEGA
jgi:hypothetical protein